MTFVLGQKAWQISSLCGFLCGVTLGVARPCLALSTTDTPPAGVRAAAFVWGSSAIVQNGFDENGKLQSLASPINRSVTIEDLGQGEPRLKKLQSVLNSLGPDQWGDRLLLADLFGEIRAQESRYVVGFLRGLTDAFGVGLRVPIIERSVKTSFRIDTQNRAAQMIERVGNIPQLREGLEELRQTAIDRGLFEQRLFTDNGYKVPTSLEARALGDIELEGRYRYYQSSRLSLALRGNLRLPTSTHDVDLRNLIDRPLGQGDSSFRLGHYQDVGLVPGLLSWNSNVGLTLHTPSTQRLAVARSGAQILPNLNDGYQIEDVARQTGPELDAETGLMLNFYEGFFSLSGAYQYTVHAQDQYRGSRALDYARLARNTAWQNRALEVSFEVSSVPLFLKGQAAIPFRWALSWNQPLAGGKNTVYAPYGRMDFVVLF